MCSFYKAQLYQQDCIHLAQPFKNLRNKVVNLCKQRCTYTGLKQAQICLPEQAKIFKHAYIKDQRKFNWISF